ncbi:hypothetical protein [Propionivibrio sp.]|uniref:hypothetical protein n=1 Tax=Propionivibrio sp. TaxID=2212460 RepID=UPI0039E283A7
MKLHIENVNITLAHAQPPVGLFAALAIASAAKASSAPRAVPAVGDKWPGLAATYAGVSLSKTGDRLVHLILWDDDPQVAMNYEDAVKHAENVKPDMDSHLPTRHQGLTLFDNLRDRFETSPWYWLLTKTLSGKAAFVQSFVSGSQDYSHLSSEVRVRAVSEIPL